MPSRSKRCLLFTVALKKAHQGTHFYGSELDCNDATVVQGMKVLLVRIKILEELVEVDIRETKE